MFVRNTSFCICSRCSNRTQADSGALVLHRPTIPRGSISPHVKAALIQGTRKHRHVLLFASAASPATQSPDRSTSDFSPDPCFAQTTTTFPPKLPGRRLSNRQTRESLVHSLAIACPPAPLLR